MRSIPFLVAITLLPALPLQAWNATGHRVIAAIGYDHLTPRTRALVDALLQKHPDYATLLSSAAADPAIRARDAFLAASVWPDVIKGDNRFYDDTRQDAQPTPLLPGFPSMARHTNWHYIDIPFSPDGTPLEQPKPPNALEQLQRILKRLRPSDPEASYELPWLIHIEGDVHQPLHCVGRFVKSTPHGDAGGNSVFVTPGRNLHAFWDDLAGTDTSDPYVDRYAAEVTSEYLSRHGDGSGLSRNPKNWIVEGAKLAQSDVYTFGNETGSRENPIPLSPAYADNSRRVARDRLAIAGLRLAAVLNQKLR